jgi:hypothetical protein
MTLIKSIAQFQDAIGTLITEGDLDSALRQIHRVVDQVFCEPINTGCIYGSRLLDSYCQMIGAMNWRRVCANAQPRPTGGPPNNTVVYIASRLYPTGGHTAVLADIIRLGPKTKSVILISGTVGATDLAALLHRFKEIEQVSFECAPRGSRLEKLDWLQHRLLALSPDTVWLFNHCQDSVAVAAVQPDAGYRLRFYHHADYQLCLGVHLAYADHIDPHPMGFHNCRDKLGVQGTRYLPLVVKDRGVCIGAESHSPNQGLITCTAAPPSKVEAPYFIRYADVIPELVKTTGGKHIHIGPLSLPTRLRIRRGMRKLDLPETSFVYIPYVPSVWHALHKYSVDLYVTSFPYGGGRTLIEAMGAGVAVALHLHTHSRLLSSFDMAFEGAILWRDPQELYRQLKAVNIKSLSVLGRAARRNYEENYQEQILARALEDWQHPLPSPKLREGYGPDELQQALDITCQVSFFGVIRRMANRALRRWKSSRA